MNIPSYDHHALNLTPPVPSSKGLDSFISSCIGQYKCRKAIAKKLLRESEKIIEDSYSFQHYSDKNLQSQLNDKRSLFRRQKNGLRTDISTVLPLLAEASKRTIGLRPYPVQILGVLALHKGYLAEMATGEGKSLTACLRAILAGWTERPCHIITVNDYLAKRDAIEMLPLYEFCRISVTWIEQQFDQDERRKRYRDNVVYITSKEILADFLRDRLLLGRYYRSSQRVIQKLIDPKKVNIQNLTMRGIGTAIVDEADSILIDEAVTPLIISQSHENNSFTKVCKQAFKLIKNFQISIDYKVNSKYQEIHLTLTGNEKIEATVDSLPSIMKVKSSRDELIIQALSAREFYHRNEHYVIQDDKVIIVDEFTGRIMPSRSWQFGLHQAIEAKEGLELSSPKETIARLSFQNFFKLFKNLSGLTGTASEAKKELWAVYHLPVMTIPTNKPCRQKIHPIRVFHTINQKWESIVEQIKHYHHSGRPVLVGTRSVKASTILAETLSGKGLQFNLLNALQHKEEAEIIAAAGKHRAITIATNMAGRGTDIKLAKGVTELGGLHVIATEWHESERIDRQLFGRCARQGDPGSCQAFVSLEDDLFERHTVNIMKKKIRLIMQYNLPFVSGIVKYFFVLAQNRASRTAYRQRKNLSQIDTWLEEALSFGNIETNTN